ncbi:alpha-ketoglutarate-dependent dioxygenase AlkB [Chryseobacterium sp. CH25]|uniref:alpha-ketoglutarate-dependent dioxygenase AlkB n=1 Tax=Chryseobacterium sp. CH25 TaxID=713559 RepID=UPI001E501751|nr:alpha-ketoglutarate-dependent dioxygenase AlkB [Chryseobacterium sp. CH25]
MNFHFNGVLVNLYRNNNSTVAWHRDKESKYGKRPVIASVSLGQTRNFDFKNIKTSLFSHLNIFKFKIMVFGT